MNRTCAFSLKGHGSSDQWEAAEGKSICFCFLGNLLPSKPVIQLMVVGRLELTRLSHLATPWTGHQCARPVQGSFVEPTAYTYSCAGALHVNYSVVVSWCSMRCQAMSVLCCGQCSSVAWGDFFNFFVHSLVFILIVSTISLQEFADICEF